MITSSDYYAQKLQNPGARLAIVEDEPQPGRYRMKRGDSYQPVAIWIDEAGETMILVGDALVPASEHAKIWTWCAGSPISPESYDAMMATDKTVDPIYAPLPDSAFALLTRVQRIGAMPTAPGNAAEAERLADAAHLLKRVADSAEETAKLIAEPLKRQIDDQTGPWREVAGLAKALRDPIMATLARYLSAKNETGGVKGQLGKAISLRTDKSVEVFDLDAALAHFGALDPDAFRATVEKMARAALKDGGAAPGCRIIETRRAQ